MRTTTHLALWACLLLLAAAAHAGHAQKMLLLESARSVRPKKMFIGHELTYATRQTEGSWRTHTIEDILPAQGLLILDDRYVALTDITALRQYRGWADAMGVGLMTFGVAWSGFALIGYATDNDPDTRYSLFDATVSATALASGFAIQRLLRHKRIKLGKHRRLRLLDLTF